MPETKREEEGLNISASPSQRRTSLTAAAALDAHMHFNFLTTEFTQKTNFPVQSPHTATTLQRRRIKPAILVSGQITAVRTYSLVDKK